MSNMVREGTCSTYEFLDSYRSMKESSRFTIGNFSLKGNSLRYKAFNKSFCCAECGMEVKFIAFERKGKDLQCHAN